MAKSQTNASTGAANTLINQANTQMPGVISGIQGQQQQAQGQANQTFGQAQSGYNQQQTTGGYDPTQPGNLRSEFQNFANTGGYDPTQLSTVLSGYGDLASTGGYTPQQQQAFVNQATSGVTNTASNLSSAAARNAAATGGNAQAAIESIQDTAGSQQADATQNALLGLNQQMTANKLSGLGGIQSTEQQVAGAKQGGAALQSGLESGVASGVQNANAGLSGLYNTATGQATALGQQVLAGLGLQYGTEAQGAQILAELSKNPGLFQTGFTDFVNFLSATNRG